MIETDMKTNSPKTTIKNLDRDGDVALLQLAISLTPGSRTRKVPPFRATLVSRVGPWSQAVKNARTGGDRSDFLSVHR